MKQLGFSLLEVMVALVLFSLSLLAALSLEIKSERQQQASQYQLLAVEHMQFISTCLKVDEQNTCIRSWQQLARNLPQGAVSITRDKNIELFQLKWRDPVSNKTSSLVYHKLIRQADKNGAASIRPKLS
ncbi:MAG: hypothetical protein K0Q57_874 [Gammaproteobacteria bacterium]|nr:hypothetical protein [Gammaproteobacteria bacterium]